MAKYFAPIKGAGAERRDGLGKTAIGDTGQPRKRPHRGNDWGFFTGSLGQPVYSMVTGVVTKVSISTEVQGYVTILGDDDDVHISLCHLDPKTFKVKKGQRVIGGETHLGNLGPYIHGPHLHVAAAKDPSPLTCATDKLVDAFKLVDASKPKKPATDSTPKKAPTKKKAAKNG